MGMDKSASVDNESPNNRWVLRPGDLPPPFWTRKEPEFRSLENNVVFRAMSSSARTSSPPLSLYLSRAGYLILIAPLLLVLGEVLSIFSPYIEDHRHPTDSHFFLGSFEFSVIAMAPLFLLVRRATSTPFEALRLSEKDLREVIRLPMSRRDWSTALWAASAFSRSRKLVSVAVGGMVLFVATIFWRVEPQYTFPEDAVASGMRGGVWGVGLGLLLGASLLPPRSLLPSLHFQLLLLANASKRSKSGMIYAVLVTTCLGAVILLLPLFDLGFNFLLHEGHVVARRIYDVSNEEEVMRRISPFNSYAVGLGVGLTLSFGLYLLWPIPKERHLRSLDRNIERIVVHLKSS